MNNPVPEVFCPYFAGIPERFVPLFLGAQTLWEPLDRLQAFLTRELKPANRATIKGSVHIERLVEIGEGTVIEHGAVIIGPAIIGKNCEIRAGAYIRGQVVVGDGCIVGHTTEVIRSVFFDGVHADHFNYVGDSILGAAAHLGAGAKIANLRFDKQAIRFAGVDTKRRKFGVILGDNVQLGVNVMLGPGIAVEKDVWIPSSDQRKSGAYRREDIR